ncbi:hypothetical protein HANVADRAFT_25110 [Hanseniaspora valbyensis NRRL Y-1626]|uniref:Nucleoporin NDC1 n=1 Tax=Hanseniaspora valbyensis NRRL Y-1626 TaxID=766949 RepID=A0A1B7TCN1_9ASCO|nr:hypothetical protein HANVADRAFT_25110 [Hanseniaspora valbyensis NRRL Y-1626]
MAGSYNNGNDNYNAFLLNDDLLNNNNRHYKFGNNNPLYSLKNNETVKNIVNNDIVKRLKHVTDTNAEEHTFHSSNRFSYNFIFANICKLRFKYLITRFLITFAIFVKIIDYLFVKIFSIFQETDYSISNSYFFIKMLKLGSKILAIYGSFLIIELTRKNYLHVSFKRNNLLNSITKFFHYQVVYLISFLLLTISLGSFDTFYQQFETKTIGLLTIISLSMVYTLKHLMTDSDRLVFTQGAEFYQNPQSFIKISCYKKLVSSLKFASLNVTKKSTINFLSFKQLLNIFLVNVFVIFLWEILNISFNAYLSIGPLHKGKLISLMSSTPINTLVDGLRNKNSFTRLTAFQELSLRSQLRVSGNLVENIYRNAIYKNKNNWFNILKECLKTINDTNEKIVEYNLKINFRKDNEAYLNKLTILQKNKNLEKLLKLQENEHLFGNNLFTRNNNNSVKPEHIYDNSNDIQREDDSYLNGNLIMKYVYPSLKKFFNNKVKKFLFPDVSKPVITLQPELNTSYDSKFNKIFRNVLAKINVLTKRNTFMNGLYVKYTNNLLEKDAQEICPLPTVYAESVFAMCSLLIHSLEESPKSCVVSSINEILKTYQISSVILGEYCDLVSQEREHSNKNTTSIEILYDIVLAAFLEVVTKYKFLLKDIELDEDVKDLINCVLE